MTRPMSLQLSPRRVGSEGFCGSWYWEYRIKVGGQIHCFPTKMEHLKGQSGGYHVLWCRELGYSNTNSMIIYLWSSMRGDSTVFEKVISCHSCHPRYVQSLDSEWLKFGICSSICIFNLEIQLVFISLHLWFISSCGDTDSQARKDAESRFF